MNNEIRSNDFFEMLKGFIDFPEKGVRKVVITLEYRSPVKIEVTSNAYSPEGGILITDDGESVQQLYGCYELVPKDVWKGEEKLKGLEEKLKGLDELEGELDELYVEGLLAALDTEFEELNAELKDVEKKR